MRCLYWLLISYITSEGENGETATSDGTGSIGDTNGTDKGGVVSCNNGDVPEMKIQLSKSYVEESLAAHKEKFNLVNGFYEKTIAQENLDANWADKDYLTLSYVLSGVIEQAGIKISSGKAVEFVCHYARSLELGKAINVTDDVTPGDKFNAIGELKYEMEVEENAKAGGNVQINIKPLHKVDYIYANAIECYISYEEKEFYLLHSFTKPSEDQSDASKPKVCLNKLVNVNMSTAQDDISISYRAFKFYSTVKKQTQQIVCTLYLDKVANQETSECSCFNKENCGITEFDACTENSECDDNATCSTDSKCVCNDGFYGNGKTCTQEMTCGTSSDNCNEYISVNDPSHRQNGYTGCYKRSGSEVENGRPVYYKIDQDGHYTSRKFFYRSGGTGWEVQGLATLKSNSSCPQNGETDNGYGYKLSCEDCSGFKVQTWTKNSNQYLKDYTSLGAVAFESLAEAQAKCLALPEDDCGGVTWVPKGYEPQGYQLRKGGDSDGLRPSSRGEISYMRPHPCPSSHPYAYLKGGYCCATNNEKDDSVQHGAACDGSVINRETSECCANDKHVVCPFGSNCLDFDAKDPVTTAPSVGNAVLVLSTANSGNVPMVVDFDGNVNRDLTFEYGEKVQVFGGCGVTFLGEFWYFGGAQRRMVAKIIDCQMVKQSDMAFNFNRPACNTFNDPEPRVLLCFDETKDRDCHLFDGEHFHAAGSSKYSHKYTSAMANYMGTALTTGCGRSSSCYVKTELMDMTSLQWTDGPDWPFASRIYWYSTAATAESAYIIGGEYNDQTIAEFRNNAWRQLGNLVNGRRHHGSITVAGQTMIIGGYGGYTPVFETEVWDLVQEGNKIINPTLTSNHYVGSIALYNVDFDFCRK